MNSLGHFGGRAARDLRIATMVISDVTTILYDHRIGFYEFVQRTIRADVQSEISGKPERGHPRGSPLAL
jgi:hypothetical protein